MTKTTPPTSKYPEHDKLNACAEESQAQGEFIAWLSDELGYELAYWETEHRMAPGNKNIRDLLAQYHGIDQKRLEQEKRDMLEEFRKLTEKS